MDKSESARIQSLLCQFYGIGPEELAWLSPEDQQAMLDYVFDPTSPSVAIQVINALNDAEIPVPLCLQSWQKAALSALSEQPNIKRELKDAIDAQSEQPGVKRRLKSEATKDKQRDAVFGVVRRMSFGDTRDEAIEKVAAGMNYKIDTLFEYYRKNPQWRAAAWDYVRDNPEGRTQLWPKKE
ncbi:hypothetical protein CCR95_20865 [Thiocystis minor]|uniref:hypothetical protein n=1 Tax=Thiocystis minor TaxID=61597 RepID=UPI001912CD3A|nr:hypothetical protein [Thiocystis minor]MBK5966458.1 hypothetical protein [Thiocystis minor]